MKRILFITNSVRDYGAEKMLLWVCNNIGDDEIAPSICSFFDERRSPLIDTCIPSYECNIRNGCKRFNLLFYLWKVFLSLNKIFRTCKFDYVVSFGHNSFYIILLLKIFYGYRVVVSERNDPYSLQTLSQKIKRKCFRFADIIVFQTQIASDFFSQAIKKKSVIIPNPVIIPTNKWKRAETSNKIVNVARLDVFQKRQDVLLKAFCLVNKKYPDCKLNLCGEGGSLFTLIDLTKQLGIENSVFFRGRIDDVNEELLNSDIFVLTSDFEGIPNALMEAMAIGMPVVSTDCSPGGAALLIQHGINGLLCKCGDPEDIANAIVWIIENPSETDRMAMMARLKMREFAPEIIKDKWRAIFYTDIVWC